MVAWNKLRLIFLVCLIKKYELDILTLSMARIIQFKACVYELQTTRTLFRTESLEYK